jgi:sec-independent protein translocase protein TatC
MSPPSDLGSSAAVGDQFTEAAEASEDRSRMSFLDHLDELRRRILHSLYVLTACCAVTFYFWDPLYEYYVSYFGEHGGQLIYTQPMAGFIFSLKISALAGLVIASPFIFTQIWLFVAPGLYAKEKKVVIPFVFSSSLCFFGGAYFAHAIAFPSMWVFFASYQMEGQLGFLPTIDTTFSFYVKAVLGLGLVFQMPMMVFFLARFGVISAGMMLRQFKYAVLGIIVLAAIITPSSDPVNLAVFSAPMLGLYVLSIGIAWLFGKKRRPEGE